jgi:hypothetical protein
VIAKTETPEPITLRVDLEQMRVHLQTRSAQGASST